MLVDDHPANLLVLQVILEPLGHRLVRANSGREALERVRTEDFAVILLDVNMPIMDGFQTAEELRALPRTRSTPIIFVSAVERDPAEIRKGYRYGAVDFLVKPLVQEILRSKVSVFVELFLQSEQLKQRKAAEEKLRETQARLSLAQESGRLGAWEWSLLTNRFRFSPMLEQLHGLAWSLPEPMVVAAVNRVDPKLKVDILELTKRRHRDMRYLCAHVRY
ncbi:MAG TPA: response regulator [Pseudomonadota bacterium]|nr:response regulator [Pseudomonadota bacterium]